MAKYTFLFVVVFWFVFCSFFRVRSLLSFLFFFQAEDGIRDHCVTGVQTCALPIWPLVEWVKVCPEVEVGMGTPREPIHLAQVDGRIRLLTVNSGVDHTASMTE